MRYTTPTVADAGARNASAAALCTIVERWLVAVHRLNELPEGCPAASAALRELDRLEDAWHLATA
jgi:hypothetical protein